MRRGLLAELGVGVSELLSVAGGLFEVVTRISSARRPGLRALRDSRRIGGAGPPGRLREGVIGRVADQQVAEPVSVIDLELRTDGADELLRTSASSRWSMCPSPSARARAAPRWKMRPSTEPRSSTAVQPLRAGRAVRPGGPGSSEEPPPAHRRSRGQAQASPLGTRDCLLRNRRSARAAPPARRPARSSVARSRRHRAARAGSWSRSTCRRPTMACVPSSSGRAMHSSKIGASRERSPTCSTRSSSVSAAQCRSSKTHTNGRCCATCSNSLRNPQAISSALADSFVSPSSDRKGLPASPSAASPAA